MRTHSGSQHMRVTELGHTCTVDDSNATLGKRYARNDELGIPFACTVDFTSLEDSTVTLRERDSMVSRPSDRVLQIRLPAAEIGELLDDLCCNSYANLGLTAVQPEFRRRSMGANVTKPSEDVKKQPKKEPDTGASKYEEETAGSSDFTPFPEVGKIERVDTMVELLNVIHPKFLDKSRCLKGSMAQVMETFRRVAARWQWAMPTYHWGEPAEWTHPSVSLELPYATLSPRGVAFVGGLSWICWYLLRLVLRDLCRAAHVSTQKVVELHALSSLHALGWAFFLFKKLHGPLADLPRNCSRGLVLSLGFYLHDIWVLRGTLLRDPSMLAHQATMALTISSILRSKGVSWLATFLMSSSVPTLLQEFLLLCGTLRLPPTRLEVRGLRLLWFTSFVACKLALIPLWLRSREDPDFQQHSLLPGKLSYLLNLGLNFNFIAHAARDLPRFLRPQGVKVPTRTAYAVPLAGAKVAATRLVASTTLVAVFGSYLSAPAAFFLAVLALFRSSAFASPIRRSLRFLAAASVLGIGLDQLLPMAKECDITARWWLPCVRQLTNAHRHRFYPDKDVTNLFKKDRQYLLAVTPHGFFPWGVAGIIIELLNQGYLPNFVGASVLGKLPVAGRLLRFFGYKPATPEAIRECLAKEYPRNVTIIIPGGISEMFKIREDVEVSCANTRLGFVKLAKEQGVMLVPGYMLGNSQLYQVAKGFLGQLFENISRRLKTSITPFHGRWGTLLCTSECQRRVLKWLPCRGHETLCDR
ncbi:grs1 [Symbiodinium sp. KB8]|nr:grs1 [Symbiodinium sp. KB8]